MHTIDRQLVAAFPDTWNREHAIVTYLDRLFGPNRRGYVAVAHGTGMRYDERGKYRHRRWSERFFRWPDDLNALVRWARGAGVVGDVYVCPALRVGRDRSKSARSKGPAPASWAWIDCDGAWTEEHQELYSRLERRGAFTVASGTGRHLYVPVEPDLEQADLESANRGLAGLFDGDAKWAGNSLLRLPGTYNWKQWTRDRSRPVPVVFA
jgi:hypothetical protein